jgi:hypothetical protein
MRKIAFALLSALALGLNSFAQDYPYDEYVPELRKKKEFDPTYQVPIERPKNPSSTTDTVFGINLQGGGTFAIVQNRTVAFDTTTSGPGYTVALGFGWDMLRHPLSIEVETGFQQNLLGTTDKYTVVPVKFSTYYWTKLSKNAVFRIGIGTSLDLRMQPATASLEAFSAVFPGWHISMIYEYASFTFEPALQISRLGGGDSFVLGAFYLGYRI